MYLAGGMAVHLYTANRVTTDVIAEFAGRVMLPQDILIEVVLEDGTPRVICLDTNHNPTFALMHEDCQDRVTLRANSSDLLRPSTVVPQPASGTLSAPVAVRRRRACAYVEGAETIR